MRLRPLIVPITALSVALFACTGDDGHPNDDHHADGDTHGDTHGDTAGETTHGDANCATEDRDDEFMVGLSKSGESVTVTFMSADPAPPAMGNNTWMISVTDPGGAPLDVGITVVPFMPDHGHGTPVEAEVTPGDNAGEYMLTPVNLFMAGLWEVTLDIDNGGVADSVVFAFCVDE